VAHHWLPHSSDTEMNIEFAKGVMESIVVERSSQQAAPQQMSRAPRFLKATDIDLGIRRGGMGQDPALPPTLPQASDLEGLGVKLSQKNIDFLRRQALSETPNPSNLSRDVAPQVNPLTTTQRVAPFTSLSAQSMHGASTISAPNNASRQRFDLRGRLMLSCRENVVQSILSSVTKDMQFSSQISTIIGTFVDAVDAVGMTAVSSELGVAFDIKGDPAESLTPAPAGHTIHEALEVITLYYIFIFC
jgi:hypothetical protein